MIKALAFDVDGTLTESKSRIQPEMIDALHRAMFSGLDIVLVTGGQLSQITSQVSDHLNIPSGKVIYAYPTSGARAFAINDKHQTNELYAKLITDAEKEHILSCLYSSIMFVGFKTPLRSPEWGPAVEDRGTQITYSALGQSAPLDVKRSWDPVGIKRKRLISAMNLILDGFQARMGGTTSVDITRDGIDKKYAMQKFLDETKYSKDDVLFFGDALFPGGNDYPVAEFGIVSIGVKSPKDCLISITNVLNQMGA